MIKHIVLFKFKEENKTEFMKQAKQELESLVDKIEELKAMEVGISYLEDDSMPDLSLTSTFENKEGLKVYATHPEHLKVVDLIKPMTIGRWVVDYEI
jgi:coproporphyrinogen III oxidase-like Fe-S oxidoreductase